MTAPQPMFVVDSSALVALLGDGGAAGAWVASLLGGGALAAPHLALFEAANILRRQVVAGSLTPEHAAQAHADLVQLPVDLWPYTALAARVWELRENVTCHDASYVALAELLDAPVVTLDRRLARAPGLRCPVLAFEP